MSLSTILLRIRSSFWYLPSLYGVLSFGLAIFSLQLDAFLANNPSLYRYIPSMLLSDIDLAQEVLSSISASLLTMTTITFSSILIVLTTYLSQFSPRTIQNFITDHNTQRVLGVFVAGFVYSILLLLLLRESEATTLFIVPTLAVIFAIICLAVFVFFIHHVSSWIQVSNLIHHITLNTIEAIEKQFQDRKDVHDDSPWEDWESAEIKHRQPIEITAARPGYVLLIDINGIIDQASKDDCIIRIEKKHGEYVDHDTPLLSLWKINGQKDYGDYLKYISLGSKRAPVENIEFGLTKLVEIALRALSPGINDPNTAINCIEQLGKILARIGKKHLPRSYHSDKHRNLRVMLEQPAFSDYLYKSFYQIRHYGAEDVSVLSAIIQALLLIAVSNHESIKNKIWEFTLYIIEGINQQPVLQLDKRYLNEQLQALARATAHREEFKPLL